MQKEILFEIVKQNEFTSHFSLDKVSAENAALRLNPQTASIGFIYRHIGETMHLFGQFFGVATTVQNSTIGHTDDGKLYDVAESRALIASGYAMLRGLVESTASENWLAPIDTPFFGTRLARPPVQPRAVPHLAPRRPNRHDPR